MTKTRIGPTAPRCRRAAPWSPGRRRPGRQGRPSRRGRAPESTGYSLGDVASCFVNLSDLSLFQRYNAVWEHVFASEPGPVRTTVGAPLLNEMLIEVTAIARRS